MEKILDTLLSNVFFFCTRMSDPEEKLAPEATASPDCVDQAQLARMAELTMLAAERLERLAFMQEKDGIKAKACGDGSHRSWLASNPYGVIKDAALALPRLGRCLRLTVALKAKLRDDADKKAAADLNAQRIALQQPRPPYRPSARRKDVERAVRMQIERQDQERETQELLEDMRERLFEADYPPFATKPVSELVARICNDLKVSVDWSLFDDENWARHEMLTRPGRSYYTPPERRPPKPPPAPPKRRMTQEEREEANLTVYADPNYKPPP